MNIRSLTRAAITLGALLFLTVAAGKSAPQTALAAPASTKRAPNVDRRDAKKPKARPKATRKTLAGKLNLNTASEKQLMMLPGVGPTKAERIVDYRRKRRFARVRDLRRVKGFGYKSLKKLEAYLEVKGANTLKSK